MNSSSSETFEDDGAKTPIIETTTESFKPIKKRKSSIETPTDERVGTPRNRDIGTPLLLLSQSSKE